MGGVAGSGGSDKSDERKVDTYADQLKKEQARKSKFKTDKFGYKVKKNIVERYVDNNPIIQTVKNVGDKMNLNRRMKFANKNNINLQGLSTEEILSKDFKSKLDEKGYTREVPTGGNDNRDNNNQTVLSTNTEATSGVVTNNITAPTNAEVTQAQSTDMSADQILVANKKKGRSQTILQTAQGLGGSTANTMKKTLGA